MARSISLIKRESIACFRDDNLEAKRNFIIRSEQVYLYSPTSVPTELLLRFLISLVLLFIQTKENLLHLS